MAVTGIANHADLLASQPPLTTQEVPKTANASATGNTAARVGIEDTFTPSSQNITSQSAAQAAGLFQIPPAPATATAAIPQTAFNTNQESAPAPVAAATALNATALSTAAGVTDVAVPAAAPQVAAAPAPQAAAPPAAQATAAAAASAANQLAQIEALNNQLATLGLSPTYFGQIDQIASLNQDFNPGAYANLVYLDEALAQAASTQNAANAAAASAQNAVHVAAANTQTGIQQTSRNQTATV
jgi:hypothetical protein